MKSCTRCKLSLSNDQFYAKKSKKDGLQSWCKSCCAEVTRNLKKATPDKFREKKWKEHRIFNSDGSPFLKIDFDRLYQIQSGKCAICGTHQSDLNRTLCVDHDHATGKVRGLLCLKCNIDLGLLENKLFMGQANVYLNKYQTV